MSCAAQMVRPVRVVVNQIYLQCDGQHCLMVRRRQGFPALVVPVQRPADDALLVFGPRVEARRLDLVPDSGVPDTCRIVVTDRVWPSCPPKLAL